MKPTIGRIVIYRSKIDNGPGNDVLSPAMVIRTRDTTVSAVIDRWGPEPVQVEGVDGSTHETASRPAAVVDDLPDDDTVDLAVFGLGKTYREYAAKRGRRKGEWEWPEREGEPEQQDNVAAEILPRWADESIDAAVFQAVGGASMCWSEPPTGVFDSDRASKIGQELLERIAWDRDRSER